MIEEATDRGLHEGLSTPEVKALHKDVYLLQKLQRNLHSTLQKNTPINLYLKLV
jgi:hypothetical protein